MHFRSEDLYGKSWEKPLAETPNTPLESFWANGYPCLLITDHGATYVVPVAEKIAGLTGKNGKLFAGHFSDRK